MSRADRGAFIPHWFRRQAVQIYDLTPAEQAVYATFVDHVDRDGVTFCSMRQLAEQANVAKSTVQLAVARLVGIGLIVEVEAARPYRAPRYRMAKTLPIPDKVVPMPTRRATWQGNEWVAEGDGVVPITVPYEGPL